MDAEASPLTLAEAWDVNRAESSDDMSSSSYSSDEIERRKAMAEYEACLAEWAATPGLQLLEDSFDMSHEECEVFDRGMEAGGEEEYAINEEYCQAHPDSRYAYLWASEKGEESKAAWLAKYLPVWAAKEERIEDIISGVIDNRLTCRQAAKKLRAEYGYRVVVRRLRDGVEVYPL